MLKYSRSTAKPSSYPFSSDFTRQSASSLPRFGIILAILICTRMLTATTAVGQDEDLTVTRAYAIRGATIVTEPGKVLHDATVVVRDGLLVSVGTSVDIPYDAHVLQGDSLFVYAGFIDGLGYIGIPETRATAGGTGRGQGPGQQDQSVNRADPDNERAGIQPERSAISLLDNEDKTIADFRKVGVTTAHAVPRGGMLPGQGAILLLNHDVKKGILAADATMFMQFQGARGVYPSTPMGIMAKFRNLYRQAELDKTWESNFAKDPTGIRRPPNDEVHEAFFPVLDGRQQVVMLANDVLTMHRARRLQADLGFNLVLAGLEQAAEMVRPIAESGDPVLLTLKLPEEEKNATKRGRGEKADSTKAEKDDEAKPTAWNQSLRTETFADTEAEAKNLKARKELTRTRYQEAAAALEKAGVPFGFATFDIKPTDFRKNLLKMIEVGLSEDAALAGLTTNPARILGIDKATGTITPGKLANLVVSSGPYFKEKSFVRYVIVDGELFEYDEPEKKSGNEKTDAGSAFAGTWHYLTDIENVDYAGSITITRDGDSYSGSIEGDNVPSTPLFNIVVDGTSISFDFLIPEIGEGSLTMHVDGESATGSFQVPDFGTLPASLKRTSKPDQSTINSD